MPKISVDDETYWKLQELKIKLKARTWKELIAKIYGLLLTKGERSEEANDEHD